MIAPETAAQVRAYAESADAASLVELTSYLIDQWQRGEEGAREVEDAFYRDLDFGTGGLRGIMGPGRNRMNRAMVARATQGLVNYIKTLKGPGASVCIAHDSRLRSREFAETAASVIAGNGMTAYLFEDLRPTPELSYAVRETGSAAGIVVTASHNPKEYNGYKVSWDDGAQVISPHDKAIITEVRFVESLLDVQWADYDTAVADGQIKPLGRAMDEAYLASFDSLCLRPELTKQAGASIKIVYTPLHGAGIRVVPEALERWGFSNVLIVPEQAQPDGTFPTAKSPNPEERAALELALELADREAAALVLATDPDSDRLGIAVRHEGECRLISGNQLGVLMAWYILATRREQGRLPANGVLVKTIVTTRLADAIGEKFGVRVENCLTGFKWIASLIREWEEAGAPGAPTHEYLFGYEESYGYLYGTHARDKDATTAACLTAELALWASTKGKTLVDILNDLFREYGVHREDQISLTMPGKAGMEQIAALMTKLRSAPPAEFGGTAVLRIEDIEHNTLTDAASGRVTSGKGLPKSNVLLFHLADGSIIATRPSGTEPKIKFYIMIRRAPGSDLDAELAAAEKTSAACQKTIRELAGQ